VLETKETNPRKQLGRESGLVERNTQFNNWIRKNIGRSNSNDWSMWDVAMYDWDAKNCT